MKQSNKWTDVLKNIDSAQCLEPSDASENNTGPTLIRTTNKGVGKHRTVPQWVLPWETTNVEEHVEEQKGTGIHRWGEGKVVWQPWTLWRSLTLKYPMVQLSHAWLCSQRNQGTPPEIHTPTLTTALFTTPMYCSQPGFRSTDARPLDPIPSTNKVK